MVPLLFVSGIILILICVISIIIIVRYELLQLPLVLLLMLLLFLFWLLLKGFGFKVWFGGSAGIYKDAMSSVYWIGLRRSHISEKDQLARFLGETMPFSRL